MSRICIALHCRPPWVVTAIIALAISACSSTGLSKRQRDVMDRYVDLVADAIHISVAKTQRALADYYQAHHSWPTQQTDQQKIFQTVGAVLKQHSISNHKLVAVDSQDVLVEYFFARNFSYQFPRMLESWVIVFSNKESDNLGIASIYPNWGNPEDMAKDKSYSVLQYTEFQNIFRARLQKKLSGYALTLDETMNQS